MKFPTYDYTTEEQGELFKFESTGPKGIIKKLVVYSLMADNDLYNLAFGDYNEDTGFIDDSAVSNNADSSKVLATVASTLFIFTDNHPGCWVYLAGSTASRTRLYQMGISINLKEITKDFLVFGLLNESWKEFKSGKTYEAFLVKRKN